MKPAFIAPHSVVPYLLDTGYYLTLPWTVRDYDKLTGYKILDNGAAERRRVSGDELLVLAGKHNVDEIVIPDVIRSYHRTVDLAHDFLNDQAQQLNPDINLMAVVQGTNKTEFEDCAYELARQDRITALGVPKHMVDTLDKKWARVDFIQWLHAAVLDDYFPAGIHCLGATDWIREVRVLSELPVRGIDTSLPVIAALQHQDINKLPSRMERPKDFFDIKGLSPTTISYVVDNQIQYLRWTNGRV